MKSLQHRLQSVGSLRQQASRFASQVLTQRFTRFALFTASSLAITLTSASVMYNRQANRRWSDYLAEAAPRQTPTTSTAGTSNVIVDDRENLAAADGPFAPQARKADGTFEQSSWFPNFEWLPLEAMPELNKRERTRFEKAVLRNASHAEGELSSLIGSAGTNSQFATKFLTSLDRKFGEQWAKVLEREARPFTHYQIRRDAQEQNNKIPLIVFRKTTLLHSLRAVALLELGRNTEALGEIRGVLRLVRALKECGDDSLVPFMVQVAISRAVLEPVWEGLASGRWSDEDLIVLERELGSIAPSRRWSVVITGERASANQALDSLAKRSVTERLTEFYRSLSRKDHLAYCLGPLLNGMIREGQLAINSNLDAAALKIDGNCHLRTSTSCEFDVEKMSGFGRSRYIFATIMLPNIERAAARVVSVEARLRQARTALALERYRRATRNYPEDLNALVPSLLFETLLDPFDGKPLRYSRDSASSYRLWSVGDDCTDHSGKSSPDDGPPVKFDLVWPGVAPETDNAESFTTAQR